MAAPRGKVIIGDAVIWIFAKLFLKDKALFGAFVPAAYRSPLAAMGFAFIQNFYGSS